MTMNVYDLRGQPFNFCGGGGGWVIWYRHEFFFQPLNSPCIFFLGVCACNIFFSPSNVLHEIFFGVWMGFKVGLHYKSNYKRSRICERNFAQIY